MELNSSFAGVLEDPGHLWECGGDWDEHVLGGGWTVSINIRTATGAGGGRRNGFLFSDE